MDRTVRKIICSVIITVICAVSATAIAQIDTVFSLPYKERYSAVYNIVVGKDSVGAYARLNKFYEAARKTSDPRDLLAVELTQFGFDLSYKKLDSIQAWQKAASLIDRAEKLRYDMVVGYVYIDLGYYYYEIKKNYPLAFQLLLKAYNHYHTLYKDDYPDMSYMQYSLALCYYNFSDYHNALKYSKDLADQQHDIYPLHAIFINDLVGMSYMKLRQYDSSLYYLRRTLELAPGHHDPRLAMAWRGIALGNIGKVWLLTGMPDTAINYLKTGEEITMTTGVWDNVGVFASQLASIYLKKNDMALAEKHLQIASYAARQTDNLDNYCVLYDAMSAFYRQKGNIAQALKYLDSARIFKDSSAAVLDVNKKYQAEIAVASERQQLSEQLMEKEQQKQRLLRNSIIVVLLLSMISILLFYNRKLLKQKLRREQLLAEKQKAETELAGAKRQLEDFTRHITEKNELLEALKEKTGGSADPNIILQLQQSTLLTDEQWDDFRGLFEKAYGGYMYRLKEKMPGLTPAEMRFLVLCKLKLSNKEMSAMLGNSPDAIRQYRTRLRKKFSIPEEKSMEDIADSI